MAIPNSSDILEAVIQATPDAIFVKDLAGRYVLVNDAFARFIGKSQADIVGKHDLELYDARNRRSDSSKPTGGRARAAACPHGVSEGLATGEAGATQAYLVTKGVYRDRQEKFSACTASRTTLPS